MSGTLFSLVAVVLAFSALIVWVYMPSRKQQINEIANLVFDEVVDDAGVDRRQARTENDDE